MNAESAPYKSSVTMTVTVPGGTETEPGIYAVDVWGEAFYLVGASAPIRMATDVSAAKEYRKGTGEQFPPGLTFRRLQAENRGPDPIRITVWAGFGSYIDNRVDVIETFTESRGRSDTIIPGNSGALFSGIPQGRQTQRKSLVITNLDPQTVLRVKGEDDNYICAVFPQTTIMLPISGRVLVENPTGAPVSMYSGEIWYVENGS